MPIDLFYIQIGDKLSINNLYVIGLQVNAKQKTE